MLSLASGAILVAEGVHGQHPDDPSELRGIRAALQRRADQEPQGSGLASRALAAVSGRLQATGVATASASSPGPALWPPGKVDYTCGTPRSLVPSLNRRCPAPGAPPAVGDMRDGWLVAATVRGASGRRP
jgi:hypothetical protein